MALMRNGTRISVWNILTGKTGGAFLFDLNFHKFGNGGQCNGHFLGKFPESPRTFEFQKYEPLNRTFSKFREQSYTDARLSYFFNTLIHSSLEVPENSERDFRLNGKRPGLPFKTFWPDYPDFFVNGKQPLLPFCGCYGMISTSRNFMYPKSSRAAQQQLKRILSTILTMDHEENGSLPLISLPCFRLHVYHVYNMFKSSSPGPSSRIIYVSLSGAST